MPRSRELKYDFFLDEQVAALSPFARLLFQGLWCLADCEGLLQDRPARIKAQLFPYDDIDINALLDELDRAEGDFIQRYEVEGKGYIKVRTLRKNQHFHPKEKPAGFPQPLAGKVPGKPGNPPTGQGGFPAGEGIFPADPAMSSEISEPSEISEDPHTLRACARVSPPANEPGKPTAVNVLSLFSAIRAELVGGEDLFSRGQPGDEAKTAAWLASMPPEAVPEIEPAIRLACKHVHDGAEGWTDSRMTKFGFLWASILHGWPDLLEELHGCAPKPFAGRARASPGNPRVGSANPEDYQHPSIGDQPI